MNRRLQMLALVVLLLIIGGFVSYAQIFNREGVYPDLSELKSFEIYVKGTFYSFDADDRLEKQSFDKTFENGGIKFIIKGEDITGDATIIGNQGTGECFFVRTDRALLIMESPPLGSTHYLIVYNDWSKAEKGFRCVYVRHHPPVDMTIIGGKAGGSSITTSIGVAKPL